MLAGADFIKTSTGKVAVNATPANTLLMLEAVRDFRAQTGVQVGVKPAGGIRTTKDAIKFLVLVNETVGRGLAGQPLVPLRRLQPAERPADAAPEAGHRPLLRPRLRDGGLITMASVIRVRTGPRVPLGRRHRAVLRPVHRRRVHRGRRRQGLQDRLAVAPRRSSSEVAQAGAEDVDRAVKAARKAFEKWSALPGSERAKYLFRIARIIQERSRELAVLETLDNGKPIKETRDADLPLVAAHFFYYAGWADKLDHAGFGANPRPLGVAGQVIPWNFPLLMLAWKIAPALATGNTVVLKPAETTPLSALFFADICRQAGLPEGRRQHPSRLRRHGRGARRAPGRRTRSPSPARPAVGKAIARQVAGTGKKVTLELGGKGANIVFDDAPIDQAVEGIVNGIFFNQGQVCCAGSRLLVQESIQDELLDSLKRRLSTLRLGDPLDKNTDIGAINSAEQLARITALAETGEAEGAERWSAGLRTARPPATGSPRRSSRTSPRRTPSPATRSSARCCPC